MQWVTRELRIGTAFMWRRVWEKTLGRLILRETLKQDETGKGTIIFKNFQQVRKQPEYEGDQEEFEALYTQLSEQERRISSILL
jgi:hypothetical protein